MTKSIRSQLVLTVALSMFSAAGFAQSGEATYKAKCASYMVPLAYLAQGWLK